jgi:TolB-like protein/Tfp pilus assembly protein PilF
MPAEPPTRPQGDFPAGQGGYSVEVSRDIRLQLLKIQQSGPFSRSRQMQNLLEFLVEAVLTGRQDHLKETSIGHGVFNRPAAYDPKLDPVVRIEARRLRSKLNEYYLSEGQADTVFIELNKGGYIPTVTFRMNLTEAPAAVAPPEETVVIERAIPPPLPLVEASEPPTKRPRLAARQIWTLCAGALVCLALADVLFVRYRPKAVSPGTHSISSVVVLPFVYQSGGPDEAYFGEGITDALITRLAQISSLTVVSRISALQYRDAHKPLPQIARELNVDAAVEGSIVRAGKKIRIFAKLLDARADRYTWAESFEDDETNPLALQDRVARTIDDQITARLPGKHTDTHSPQTPVVFEAYDAGLKGRYFLEKRTPANMQKSLAAFQEALSLDSHYAPAYAGLADWYNVSIMFDLMPQKDAYEKAIEYAAKATVLDPSLSGPYVTRASVSAGRAWNWEDAESNYLQAIKLDPSSSRARSGYSSFLSIMARHKESIEQIERAVRLDPLSSPTNTQAGVVYFLARQYDKAADQLRRTIAQDGSFAFAHKRLALTYEQQGLFQQADAEFLKWGPLVNQLDYDSIRAQFDAVTGNRAKAQKTLVGLLANNTDNILAPADFAMIYSALGDHDNAMKWLEQGYAERDVGLTLIGVDPRYDPLRNDSRFQDLLKRLKLPASPGVK